MKVKDLLKALEYVDLDMDVIVDIDEYCSEFVRCYVGPGYYKPHEKCFFILINRKDMRRISEQVY